MASSSSIIETIRSINRGTGITNNMMAYRLALIIEKEGRPIPQPSTVTLDRDRFGEEKKRQASSLNVSDSSLPVEAIKPASFSKPYLGDSVESELKNILTQSTQNTENYRQELKNKYLSEYLNNFCFTPSLEEAEESVPEPRENVSRVDTLIAQKKEQHLQKIINSSQLNNSILNQSTTNNPSKSTNQSDRFDENEQSNNKPLIRAILETTIAQGKDTQNEGRVYQGVFYKLQLLIKDGVQFVNVYRNQDKSKALASHKNSNHNEFTITENNLSTEEANKLIAFNNQRITKERSTHELHSNDSSELGD